MKINKEIKEPKKTAQMWKREYLAWWKTSWNRNGLQVEELTLTSTTWTEAAGASTEEPFPHPREY